MFKVIQNAWSIPDLRKKILFTLLIIVVFRIGSVIPVPFLDTNVLAEVMAPATDVTDAGSNMIAYLNTLSGGAFSNATLFAMGITPYINSSIIIQLLSHRTSTARSLSSFSALLSPLLRDSQKRARQADVRSVL